MDYVLKELDGFAKLRDEATGIEVANYERIWKSDALVPSDLRGRLLQAVATLENIPEDQKDWHPGSNGQVLAVASVASGTICTPQPSQTVVVDAGGRGLLLPGYVHYRSVFIKALRATRRRRDQVMPRTHPPR